MTTMGEGVERRGAPFCANTLLVVGAVLTAMLGSGARAESWKTVDLGPLGGSFSTATALNDSGQVVGYSYLPGYAPTHAFSWTEAGGMIDLGTLGGSMTSATGVNNLGQVVGQSFLPGDATWHAFSWTEAGGMIDLRTLGGSESYARAVNYSGQVVGHSYLPGDGTWHSFSWTQAGGIVDLGAFGWANDALAVNDSGQVVGFGRINYGGAAFSWTQAGGMIDLGNLGGSYAVARAVNDSGQSSAKALSPATPIATRSRGPRRAG